LTAVTDFLQEVASVSLKEIALVDGDRAAEILRSPVFLLLSLVAIAPLAIQSLESAHSILYGLAIWSGLLWALLMYRLFADRQVGLSLYEQPPPPLLACPAAAHPLMAHTTKRLTAVRFMIPRWS